MRRRIWVASIDHKHGTDHYAAFTEDGIWAELAIFCRHWWDMDGPGDIAGEMGMAGRSSLDGSDQEIVERYFEWQAEIGGSEGYSKSEVALGDDDALLRRIAAIAVSPEGELLQVCDVLHKAGVVEPVYSLAIHEEARGTPAADLLTAVKALLEWGRDHTSPRDPNSPHELLVAVNAAIVRMERGA